MNFEDVLFSVFVAALVVTLVATVFGFYAISGGAV